jgi:biopolymer transport protein ExbD
VGRRRRKEETPVDVTLPITPMLDMSFQLLSFFILTFHPMPTEGQLSVSLPKIDAAATPDQSPTPPEDQKDEYTITVISNSTGELTSSSISLKGPATNAESIKNLAQLRDELKKIAASTKQGAKGVSITLEASNDLMYSGLITIMDLCRQAGFDSVSLKAQGKGS